MTYTYAILEVSAAAYDEIRGALEAAGYQDAFHDDGDGYEVIDMHGIALRRDPAVSPELTHPTTQTGERP